MRQQEISDLFPPTVWMPDNIEDAWKLKQEFGTDACYIAGGTTLQTNWMKGSCCPSHLITLERISEMQGISKASSGDHTNIHVGALTTIHDMRLHPDILTNFPLLVEAVRNIAAPAIRNRATIGGNIAGGNGDIIPALLALDASVILYDGALRKSIPLWDHISEKSSESESLLIKISIPNQKKYEKLATFFQKIGRREAFVPSIVTVSGVCGLNDQGEIVDVRLAAVGADTAPQRLTGCEELLKDLFVNGCDWEKVHLAIIEEFTTSSDPIVSADYKRLAVANVIVSELAGLID